MSNKFFTSKFFYILTSVFFAIVLFFNANATAIRNGGDTTSGSVYTATISNVPIDLKYDSNKYFVSTTTSVVTVHLSGYTRLQIANETNEDTRNFYLSVDLTNAKEGTGVYPIRVEQLPSGVKAEITPTSAEITIEKKATKDFEVTPKVDPTQIPTGFKISSIDLSDEKVKVTAGEESMNKIQAIEADLPDDVTLLENYSGRISLRAVDSKGTTLPAQISPATVRMDIKVDKLSKTVPIKAKLTGTLDSSLSSMKTSLSTSDAKIYGQKADLDKISELTASVDMTGIKTEKKIQVSLRQSGPTVDPKTVEVTLTPVKKN